MSAVLDAAVGYGRRRRPVFPVGIDKRPYTGNGFKDATADERTIRDWWSRWPRAGIATPTGPNWFALDDDTNGEALARLEADNGQLPPTVEVVTPRPGLHKYLLGSVTNSDSALPDGINVRGTGGYVVLPPSPHRNGVYEWRTAPDETPIAPAPAWLLTLLTSPENGAGCGEHRARPERIPHGQRDEYLKDFAIHMLRGAFTDRDVIAWHLRSEFERACAPQPPPKPGYFERMAVSLLRTRIAGRERSFAEFAARWSAPPKEANP